MSTNNDGDWVAGKPYELPAGSQFIMVRLPAHLDASVLNNVKIADLSEDPEHITNQLTFLSTVGDGKQFAQFSCAKSFAFIAPPNKKQQQDVGEQVNKTEKRVLVPPKGLGVSRVPFAGPPLRKRPAAAKEPAEDSSSSAKESSSSKKKKQRTSSAAE